MSFIKLKKSFFFFCHTVQCVEFPQPGLEAMLPAAEAYSLNHWVTREVRGSSLLFLICWVLFFFLIMKRHWILLDSFSIYIEMIIWVLSSIILLWYVTLNDFQMLNRPYVPGVNHAFSCVGGLGLLAFWGFLCWFSIRNISV